MNPTGWIKLRLTIFMVLFVPLGLGMGRLDSKPAQPKDEWQAFVQEVTSK